MNRSHIIEALRAADWSNTPNGNLALIQAAIEHLEAQPSSAMAAIECRFEVSEDTLKVIRGCLRAAEEDVEKLQARLAESEKQEQLLATKLAMALDAAAKGDAVRHAAGGMEMEIQELREKVAELQKELRSRWTYASTQATNCAGCGEHKHTPLRVDWMGGYVCLTCIDEKLEELHDDQDQRSVPEGFREKFEQCVELAFAEISYYVSPEKACNPQSRARRASALATELRAMLASSEES
ncbi:TPA: hypothetical protein ACRMXN_003015 [Pseudomonas aeruginosa]|uniref:hypothetical protein n=1 Tax=Pseudomonas aeruginosa TaxID=287 RepID=UPI00073392D1|nr:hypothetical protein [Pseudomonas aeruginosa]OHW58421.1 hypothetical protein ABI36_0214110 [Pseudomonas aeruginosa]OOH20815.1 hypothetical protein B0B32_26260 [Pseudomonas aeruginosa]OOH38617.1 hypothetical protein B0B31_30000 [Pseudomonas aeruginosa]HCF6733713.1 hypothetical protein [Pseudomonas aeruginosa]HEJ4022829.1 hypothetical protein [Pseudomonas aeruginosa]